MHLASGGNLFLAEQFLYSVMYYLGLLAVVPAVCITCKYHFPLLLKGHSRHSISSICYFEGRVTDGRIC